MFTPSKQQKPIDLVFVYGTLKRGFHNHRLLANCEFVSEAVLENHGVVAYGIPFAFRLPGHRIKGELFRINTRALAEMDLLEGHPHNYCRSLVRPVTAKGKSVDAWCYLLEPEAWSPAELISEFKVDSR